MSRFIKCLGMAMTPVLLSMSVYAGLGWESELLEAMTKELRVVYDRYGGMPRSEGCMSYRAEGLGSGGIGDIEIVEVEFDNVLLAEHALEVIARFVALKEMPEGVDEVEGMLCFSDMDGGALNMERVLAAEKDGISNLDWLTEVLREESSRGKTND